MKTLALIVVFIAALALAGEQPSVDTTTTLVYLKPGSLIMAPVDEYQTQVYMVCSHGDTLLIADVWVGLLPETDRALKNVNKEAKVLRRLLEQLDSALTAESEK